MQKYTYISMHSVRIWLGRFPYWKSGLLIPDFSLRMDYLSYPLENIDPAKLSSDSEIFFYGLAGDYLNLLRNWRDNPVLISTPKIYIGFIPYPYNKELYLHPSQVAAHIMVLDQNGDRVDISEWSQDGQSEQSGSSEQTKSSKEAQI